MSSVNTRAVGTLGESVAENFLCNLGYKIITKNWRTKHGEIDIVATSSSGTTVFVEVKHSKGTRFGTPESWVNKRKQMQIYRLAQEYLKKNKIYQVKSRFDVVAITERDGKQKINHIKNAFIRM